MRLLISIALACVWCIVYTAEYIDVKEIIFDEYVVLDLNIDAYFS